MISTYKLTEMYNKWGDEQNLQPLGCALEEVMGNDKLSETQRNWLIRFIDVWDYSQNKEDKKYMETLEDKWWTNKNCLTNFGTLLSLLK